MKRDNSIFYIVGAFLLLGLTLVASDVYGGRTSSKFTSQTIPYQGDAGVAAAKLFFGTASTAGYMDSLDAFLNESLPADFSTATASTSQTFLFDGTNWTPSREAHNVVSYGAIADSASFNSATAIQAAIDAAETAGGGTIYFPDGLYYATTKITIPRGSPQVRIFLVGESGRETIIRGVHTGTAVISMKGAMAGGISNLTIDGDDTSSPKTGLTLGRSSAGSAGTHYFENLNITGDYSVAALYMIASEENVFVKLNVTLQGGTAKYALYTSQSDSLSVESLTGASNWVNTFIGGNIYNLNEVDDAATIYLQTGNNSGLWEFINVFLVAAKGSFIELDVGTVAGDNTRGPYTFRNNGGEVWGETVSDVTYGIKITATGTRTIQNLTMVNNGFAGVSGAGAQGFYSENNITLENAYIDNYGAFASSLYSVTNSTIKLTGGDLTFRGAALNNTILYDSSDTLIITGTDHGNWIHTLNDASDLKYTGKLGIGTDTPVAALHLRANSGSIIMALQGTGTWKFTDTAGVMSVDAASSSFREFNIQNTGAGDVNVTLDNDLKVIERLALSSESTFGAADTSPSVAAGNLFATLATPSVTIADLDGGTAGQRVIIRATDGAANAADAGNLNLVGVWEADSADDTLEVYTPNGTKWIELSRSDVN